MQNTKPVENLLEDVPEEQMKLLLDCSERLIESTQSSLFAFYQITIVVRACQPKALLTSLNRVKLTLTTMIK